jgi:hypothetical protein
MKHTKSYFSPTAQTNASRKALQSLFQSFNAAEEKFNSSAKSRTSVKKRVIELRLVPGLLKS